MGPGLQLSLMRPAASASQQLRESNCPCSTFWERGELTQQLKGEKDQDWRAQGPKRWVTTMSVGSGERGKGCPRERWIHSDADASKDRMSCGAG